MGILEILNPKIQDFINKNSCQNTSNLALQKNPFPEIDYKIILNQIETKKKAKDKLPSWFNTKNIIYPSKISIEQTTSESVAKYKSSLFTGKTIADLTGGFGVDCFYFSKSFNKVIHCEIDKQLSEIVKHNNIILNTNNIECISSDSIDFLKKTNEKFDYLYIDPSRRNDIKGKVFMLKDCLPNVPQNLNFYFKYSNNIVLKTAPILDISAGLIELENVKNIYIIALNNEVKELLWELEKRYTGKVEIKTINLDKNGIEKFDFTLNSNVKASFSLPKKYLYEPNSAIMKSGGFDDVSIYYAINKLHIHSHLYTSDSLISFPGRVFEIKKVISLSKHEMKENFHDKKFNIAIRNFPESVENIRKKWKIKDGGNNYSFFTTDLNNNKIALICTKI